MLCCVSVLNINFNLKGFKHLSDFSNFIRIFLFIYTLKFLNIFIVYYLVYLLIVNEILSKNKGIFKSEVAREIVT